MWNDSPQIITVTMKNASRIIVDLFIMSNVFVNYYSSASSAKL